VWARGVVKGVAEWAVLTEGTHLLMRVERDRSTASLAGVGGLAGVHESFSIWVQPALSVESELAAAAGRYSAAAGESGATVARARGAVFFGTASNEYCRAGGCSLMREAEGRHDDCEAGGSP